MAHERAGLVALESDLIDVDAVLAAYYDLTPDPSNPDQKVVFGTSGHRGSSLDIAFNDLHIAATTQAIVEYRAAQGVHGPLFIGKDTHALSLPAWRTAAEVLVANDVPVFAEREDEYTPTPAVSRAIIREGMKNVAAGANGSTMRQGIEKAIDFVVDELKKKSIPVKEKEKIDFIIFLTPQIISDAHQMRQATLQASGVPSSADLTLSEPVSTDRDIELSPVETEA